MNGEILVAILGCMGTLGGSFLGILAGTKLTNFRLKQLEDKVEKHNKVVERTFVLEGAVTEIQHDVRELKSYHRP